jgi:hypothetical protein
MPWPSYKNSSHNFQGLFVNDYTSKVAEDGEFVPLLTDNYRRLILAPSSSITTIPGTPDPTATTTFFLFSKAAATQLLKASAGRLHNFNVANRSGSDIIVQFFDNATGTVGGADPFLAAFYVAAGAKAIIDASYWLNRQKYFSTGITVAISSTPDTYTASGVIAQVDLNGEIS